LINLEEEDISIAFFIIFGDGSSWEVLNIIYAEVFQENIGIGFIQWSEVMECIGEVLIIRAQAFYPSAGALIGGIRC